MKLHELLAVEGNLRQQSESARKELAQTLEKGRTVFSELLVTFQSNEEGRPPVIENKLGLGSSIDLELKGISPKLEWAMDCAHRIDEANTSARQDVILQDGTVLLTAVPATSLLQLEKRIRELQELANGIPTLDPAKGFEPDFPRGEGIFKARDIRKIRTHKVEEFIVVVQATKEHPAQVAKQTRDVEIGEIHQQEWSSLVTLARRQEILDRLEELLRAVKAARSRANEQVIGEYKIAQKLLNYAFWGTR